MRDNRSEAIAYMDAAATMALHLDELTRDTTAPDRNARIAQANREIGHGLKLAHIHACLDIAAALRAQLVTRQ